ncbi:hypothetical protein [Streptomyces sp. SID8352]|uniref:hypothetical protein n=1 Tax=Streptomyces sp. SID8352 TaxID=2690338 RepID=UPI00136CC7D0|nr:hypothetical protein [Streptomyces sp. SID8352]MYU22896.1 hypothetical protein [Streptomyces sp. SID8352]
MCIRVLYAPLDEISDPWDRDRNVITIPPDLRDGFAVRAVRAVLDEIGVRQRSLGARCWCGESIRLAAQ